VKNSFFLIIPAQQDAPELLALYEKDRVNQWILELPTANPSLSTKLFYDFLEAFNKVVMPAQQRLDVLEMLRPSFLVIEDFLRPRLLNAGFPKGENERKVFNVLVLIEKNFTTGYWMAIRELTRRDVGWFQGKNIALALQRTIKGLSEIIVTHYMMFQVVPDWVWIDLHSLYKLSVKAKKETTKVVDSTRLPSKVSTAEDCYKQVLLLSLTDPSGLMQKEVLQVYKFIVNLCQFVKIENHPIDSQNKQCIILMDEDGAPFWKKEEGEEDSYMMYLDFSKLYKTLQTPENMVDSEEARFSSLHGGSKGSEKMSVSLFLYLQKSWKGEVFEGTNFFTDRLDRYIAIGLDATHSLQSNTRNKDIASFELLAESFSDRELSCTFNNEGVLSIGSLISFRKKNEPETKRILSVVKKITIPKNSKKIIFEVSEITPVSYAVSYTHLDNGAKGEEKHKALLYGLKDSKGERSYIIVESFMLKNEDGLWLYMSGNDFPIILGNRKNIGLGYWQFECRQIEEVQVEKIIKKKGYDFI